MEVVFSAVELTMLNSRLYYKLFLCIRNIFLFYMFWNLLTSNWMREVNNYLIFARINAVQYKSRLYVISIDLMKNANILNMEVILYSTIDSYDSCGVISSE